MDTNGNNHCDYMYGAVSVSFIIGMIRKSVPATIVTSLIVIVLRQVIITKNTTNQESILQIFIVAIVTVVITLFIFKRKVSKLY